MENIEEIAGEVISDARALKLILIDLAKGHEPYLVHGADVIVDHILQQSRKLVQLTVEK